MDDYLPSDFLADQAANSVGASHRSYHFQGRQWAIAIDAATPVASWRPDLLHSNELPKTWNDLVNFAKSGRVLMPGIPLDTLMNFYMLCSTLGQDVCQTAHHVVAIEIGTRALQMLRELATYLVPELLAVEPNPS